MAWQMCVTSSCAVIPSAHAARLQDTSGNRLHVDLGLGRLLTAWVNLLTSAYA